MIDMDMHIKLDPEEVQRHLQQLGYEDISPAQLQEFVRDLKRLIKYDLKKQKENCTQSLPSSFNSSTSASVPQISSRSDQQDHHVRRPLSYTNKQRFSINSTCSTDSATASSTSSTGSSSGECLTISQSEVTQKPIKKKPRSSFIRPRDLVNAAPPRSDPVALYHYYQQFWKQFKQPGEDEHRELRWSIRERMLGGQQSTTSRCVSRASTAMH